MPHYKKNVTNNGERIFQCWTLEQNTIFLKMAKAWYSEEFGKEPYGEEWSEFYDCLAGRMSQLFSNERTPSKPADFAALNVLVQDGVK